jgi:hypothetical protein
MEGITSALTSFRNVPIPLRSLRTNSCQSCQRTENWTSSPTPSNSWASSSNSYQISTSRSPLPPSRSSVSSNSINSFYLGKLLQQSGINFKKHYQQLTKCLIEKLSDSKVVIRQAVLKTCAMLIVVRVLFFKVVELQSEHICLSCDAVPISWQLACQRGLNIPCRSLRDYSASDESKHGWTVRATHT